jgi:PPOX class probable F420-dependent enzyme
VLAHRYAEDWATLWWVRVDGRAGVVEAEDEREKAVMLLAAKYAQYRSNPPPGDVIAVDVERWRSWPK